ncbi:MAG: transposase [Nitrospira sp.]|nr:transposase [Nitrospira sp.]
MTRTADAFSGCWGTSLPAFYLRLRAYCLMDNHFHLMVETPKTNLSKTMRQLNGVYTQASTAVTTGLGTCYKIASRAIIVDRESYLLELCRYVVLNTVRAKTAGKADTYPWSRTRPRQDSRPRRRF